MVITEEIRDEIVESDAAPSCSPRRGATRRIVLAGAAILVAGVVAAIAVVQDGGDSTRPDVTAVPVNPSSDAAVRALVERGVVPAASLDDGSQVVGRQLATPSRDEIVRDLVERGLVPAASLDNGSQNDNSSTPRSQDEIVRELVERGFIPAATLEDGSQVTSGQARSQDDVVRDLVARGLVPAATLDDGSEVSD